MGGSFHNVDLNNFDIDKVISISSVPPYNQDAIGKGVKRVILKDYSNLDDFKEKLKAELLNIVK